MRSDASRPRRGRGVCVYVEDPLALFEELESRGARIVARPERQSYGTLEFIVEDLTGTGSASARRSPTPEQGEARSGNGSGGQRS